MNSTRLSSWLLIANAALFIWLASRWLVSPPQAKASSKVIHYRLAAIQGGLQGPGNMEPTLNQLGKDGWMLVTCPNGFGYCIFASIADAPSIADTGRQLSIQENGKIAKPPAEQSATNSGQIGPKQLAPSDGATIHKFPRTTQLEWEAAPGAVAYCVEIEWGSPEEWNPLVTQRGITSTSFAFDFVGKSSGRWRVWAVYPDGHEGEKSPWHMFTYSI